LGNGTMTRVWSGGGALSGIGTGAAAIALTRGGKIGEAEVMVGWHGGHAALLG
jgi:hypothetical protein